MGKLTVEESNLSDVANSIRAKAETSGGLVFPDGFISAVEGIQKGIIPTGTKNITQNGTHDVTDFANAFVDVQPSSDYIKKSDTQNYTTQFKSSTFRSDSDIRISDVSITVGFKPKIFFIRSNSGITSTSSRYYITTSWMVTDNNYGHILSKPDLSSEARSAGSIGFFYQTNSARSAQSNSINNSFQATDDGVQGNGSTSSSYYFKGTATYFWFAWG